MLIRGRFSGNLAYFVFLLPPFRDSPFYLITDELEIFTRMNEIPHNLIQLTEKLMLGMRSTCLVVKPKSIMALINSNIKTGIIDIVVFHES